MTGLAPHRQHFIGHGVGLRVPHYEHALSCRLDVDWVECLTENFLGDGGRPRAVLKKLHAELPLVFHGVSMGIGSPEGPSAEYLRQLAALFGEFPPVWFSDHLCWTHLGGRHSHDLLPLPYTEEAINIVVKNVRRVQDTLGRRMLLENVSSYVGYQSSELSEWEFLSEISTRADCLLLLDINNIVVNAANHSFEAVDFLKGVPPNRVHQFHLANHSDLGQYKFDSHRGAVGPEVWLLYQEALKLFGNVSSLVEWDEEVPTWEVLRAEQQEAKRLAEAVTGT